MEFNLIVLVVKWQHLREILNYHIQHLDTDYPMIGQITGLLVLKLALKFEINRRLVHASSGVTVCLLYARCFKKNGPTSNCFPGHITCKFLL